METGVSGRKDVLSIADDYIMREHILALNENGCPYCGDANTEEEILIKHKQLMEQWTIPVHNPKEPGIYYGPMPWDFTTNEEFMKANNEYHEFDE